jgi:hypothetical protein
MAFATCMRYMETLVQSYLTRWQKDSQSVTIIEERKTKRGVPYPSQSK